MLAQLHGQHIHGMISVWPNFDPGSADFTELANAGCFYQNVTDGGHYVYDPYSATCRAIYSRQIQDQLVNADGWDALWWTPTSSRPPRRPGRRHHRPGSRR